MEVVSMIGLAHALSAVPESQVVEGVPSLEVRWIMPGRPDMAVAGWFARPGLATDTESREDAYLCSPGPGGLSVKVRAGQALEVKVFRGSAGVLDFPGRASGRMQNWQKGSFPFSPPEQGSDRADGWRRIRKQRRVSRFTVTDGRIRPGTARAGEAGCAAELTDLRVEYQHWWSLGLEAAGPADMLRTALEATAALMFAPALPGGAELRMEDSASYSEWLRLTCR
jgi:hypothetical protein